MKNLFLATIVLIFVSCHGGEDYTQWVDPFIGTLHEGHCFPGATVPMGMVQASPESYVDPHSEYGMDHVTGYQYNDPWIWGFTQTHLNGVGCPSMSDILLMPYCGREIIGEQRQLFKSAYDKSSECASPGYYGVYLKDNGVKVELTATAHAAYHRYRFDDNTTARLLVDLQYGVGWDLSRISGNILECSQSIDSRSINGYRKAREWAERKLFYTIEFNCDIIRIDTISAPTGSSELAPRYVLSFDMNKMSQLEVRIGLSTTSVEAAKSNLNQEISGSDDFEIIHARAKKLWNDILSKIEIDSDVDSKKMFYTSLYHLYVQPNNIADVDGRYRASNDSICSSLSGEFFSTLSLWDTYRAANPMYTILTPALVSKINASIMDHYTHMVVDANNPRESNPYLPRWALWGKETHTMIGNHAIPVLVDAWLKGIKPTGYSDQMLYQAVWNSATLPHYRNHTQLIDRYGYIPYDVQLSSIDDGRETVSRLLEGVYDDHCASLLATAMNRSDDATFLSNRAGYYSNVYDSLSGFMRGRNSKGEFKRDVDVNQVVGEWVAGSDFTEGNAWHYLFHVQHDIKGLIELMGGDSIFISKLDSMFCSSGKPFVKDLVWKIDGTLGQYWHGNEPCHHVPYLYKYTSQGYKSDAILRFLTTSFSKPQPDGLKGNDDCGQMSAWYMFAMMGFYPVDPCGGEFVLGAPQLKSAVINLENGAKFRMTADNLSEKNMFVKEVYINGKRIDRGHITYDEIMSGCEVRFVMQSRD